MKAIFGILAVTGIILFLLVVCFMITAIILGDDRRFKW